MHANLARVITKVQSIKVVRNDSIGPNHRNLYRQRFAKCFAIFLCLPHGQAKGCFVSSEKVQSIKVVRNDSIGPNHRNLYRQWFAKRVAILMCLPHGQAKGWLLRNGSFVDSLRFVSPLCDGSPDLWDGQPLPPEDGGRCCRGVPRPGPRLAQK